MGFCHGLVLISVWNVCHGSVRWLYWCICCHRLGYCCHDFCCLEAFAKCMVWFWSGSVCKVHGFFEVIDQDDFAHAWNGIGLALLWPPHSTYWFSAQCQGFADKSLCMGCLMLRILNGPTNK
ncbi:hypothetical protein U1Q18_038294 [Sarracenia purpurea var. burkii]